MPGFKLHCSNSMEVLAASLRGELTSPLASNVLTPEIIIVQSKGMQRWLSLELSRQMGVLANCTFPYPIGFIYDHLFKANLKDLPEEYPFHQDILTWKIVDFFEKDLSGPAYTPLRQYLSGAVTGSKRFRLASKIAYLFDQYLIFRPRMIRAWDQGRLLSHPDFPMDSEKWQASLWRELAENQKELHRVSLQDRLLKKLRGSKENLTLPERLFIFGLTTLPPGQIELFHALADHCEVQMFVLNPSREYWFDLVPERKRTKISLREEDTSLLDEGHKLLASWGRVGRDFFTHLNDRDVFCEENPSFVPFNNETLLGRLQSDILDLIDRGPAMDRIDIHPEDTSIGFNSCHGPMREVEVLHDALLDLLNKDSSLEPRDILVMAPDIETYAPYIQAIFGSPEDQQTALPFSISDRKDRSVNTYARAFLTFLELLQGRCKASEVLSFLEMEPVMNRYGISPEGLELIRHWMDDTQIRWGLDGEHRSELGLEGLSLSTWQSGLDRLLLGLTYSPGEEVPFDSILPYGDIESPAGETLAALTEIIYAIKHCRDVISQPHSLATWSDFLKEILDRFFAPAAGEERDLQKIRSQCAKLADFSPFLTTTVDMHSVQDWLSSRLSEPGHTGSFLQGGITFCTMVPMRSIPFRVVCLLGMNHGAFPRQDVHPDFDLMAAAPLPGDRSLRDDDRYLFLEALLSARQYFYISYWGQSIQDNSPKPPSVVVSELMDCLNQGFTLKDSSETLSQHLTTTHRLQGFHPGYFSGQSRLFSYSREFCQGAKIFAGADKKSLVFFQDSLPRYSPENRVLSLPHLIKFFNNPSKYLLNNRLGVNLDTRESRLEDDEPIDGPHGLEAYLFGERILHWKEKGMDRDQIRRLAEARQILPPGSTGTYRLDCFESEVRIFQDAIHTMAAGNARLAEVEVKLDDFLIRGSIDHIYPETILHAKFAKMKVKYILEGWLILLLHACKETGEGPASLTIISKDRIHKLHKPSNPSKILNDLLQIYREGMSRPLPFFPETSWCLADAIREKKSPRQIRQAIQKEWESAFKRPGEGEEPHIHRLFGTALPAVEMLEPFALAVFGPLMEHGEFNMDREKTDGVRSG